MKIVVLGGTGLVGSHIITAAKKRGHDVVGTTRTVNLKNFQQLELGDRGAVTRLLEDLQPSCVVYAAGWTWVDGCEKDPAKSYKENVEWPLEVARWCVTHGVRIVYFSTNYVFDGDKGNYAEDDIVNPINVYGRHKMDAEKAILDVTNGSALIPRLVCVWGEEIARKNFAYQILKAAQDKSTVTLPADQFGNPTWAGDVADWTIQLCEQTKSGIWHLAGPNPEMTRFDWARCILRGLADAGLPSDLKFELHSTSELKQITPRPLKAGLSTLKVQQFFPLNCRKPECLPVGFYSNRGGPTH
jgi:dTDP-4-dehydrorhamnose reductase